MNRAADESPDPRAEEPDRERSRKVASILRDVFALESLYPVQRRVIDRLLDGGSAFLVLPTGYGKSLCYQLPALALDGAGVTLVFSPLIALMEDQVAALRTRGVRAQYINSTLDKSERLRRYRALGDGEFDLIYATPERMCKPEFVEALRRVEGGVRLLAIDEAHCVTKWGHDFRPAYQQVGRFRKELGAPPTIALTATATPAVRADIRSTLGLDEEALPLYASGIDRPNLSFEVEPVWSDDDKVGNIESICKEAKGTVIAYFTLIKTIEEMRRDIERSWGRTRVEVYHGKLPPREKKRVYDRFRHARPEEGLLLLATGAFGMGVDKPDIRAIVHVQIPGSIEAYWQEVGRAGRDGLASRCVLLYDSADLAIQQDFIDWMNPSAELLLRAARTFQDHPEAHASADDIRADVVGRDRGDRRVEYCLITLEKMGVVQVTPDSERFEFARELSEDELDAEEISAKKERDLRRLLDLLELVQADDIRAAIIDYFGLPNEPD